MSFAGLRIYFDGFLVRGSGLMEICSRGIQNSELHVGIIEFGIGVHGLLQKRLGLLQIGRIFRSLFGTSGLLPERDGVVVVSERVGRLVAHEAREFLLGTGQRIGSGLFHLAKKKIGRGIGGLLIRCIAHPARGIAVGTAGVKRRAHS